MSEFPGKVFLTEEGPREGFQSEQEFVPTERKVALIDALSATGLPHIRTVSFVNPRVIPNMADAEEVVARMRRAPGVQYSALWLNQKGLDRAIASGLDVQGGIALCASGEFLFRNQRSDFARQADTQREFMTLFGERGIPVDQGSIIAAFGCNFEGDVPRERVIELIDDLVAIAAEHGQKLKLLTLADTMAWATPLAVKRLVGAVREAHPELEINLHLHNTRGQGIAAAYAGLEMGVARFDASVAGLGGCPFAGHKGAAGNVCTEDLVFLCEEIGIETGVDLDALIEAALLAEEIVGRPLPGSVMRSGSLAARRRRIAREAAEAASQG